MRALVVHNRYSSLVPSGENLSVQDEVGWLREAGVDVQLHTVSNDDAVAADLGQKVRQATSATWSGPARREMSRVLAEVEPDIVHVHNLFPLLTASVPWAATKAGVPVVWSVRNLRLTCVDGTHFRDGKPCYSCRRGWRVPGVRHACYRQSTAASALVTASTAVFGSLARRRVTAIAVSRSVQRWLVDSAGFPAERVLVKYNGIAPPPPNATVPPAVEQKSLLFSGKLAPYKGFDLLLDAWRRLPDLDCELRIVGDGPEAENIRQAAKTDPRINYIGQVERGDMATHFAAARAVVVPSTWAEPFGRIAAEALAFGRPVVTTALGGLGEVVDESSGWRTGADPEFLAAALLEAAQNDAFVARRGEAAKRRHTELFSPAATTARLIQIYEEAIRAGAGAGRGR
jgi:glycosyltransferase involved in cell wall biosynthesis